MKMSRHQKYRIQMKEFCKDFQFLHVLTFRNPFFELLIVIFLSSSIAWVLAKATMSPCPPLSQVFALRTWEHMQLLHPGCSTPQKSLLPLFGHRSSGMIRGSIRSRQGDIFSPRITLFRNPLSFLHHFPLLSLSVLSPSFQQMRLSWKNKCLIVESNKLENVAIPEARKIWLLLRAGHSTSWVAL